MDFRAFTIAVLLSAIAGTASAQQTVSLQFNGGQVTLSARNAPVRAILAEWARLGGATIVNGERVAGPPVTLELSGVSEREALDILLRSVAGYIAAPRPAGTQGASAFDRIMILPTSVAPRVPPPVATAAAGGPRPPIPRPAFLAPRPPDPPDPSEEAESADAAPEEDPSVTNQGRESRLVRPPVVLRGPGNNTNADPDAAAADGQEDDETTPAGVAPTPANPFGVPLGSSATPGVISPAPGQRPRPNQAPTNRVQ